MESIVKEVHINMQHSHVIIDKDNHFIIDPVTRKIQPETHEKNKLIEGDHNSEKYTFEIPKSIEGHDMSQCNIVQIHYLNVSSDKSKKVEDIYEVDDLGVLENKPDTLAFTWTIKETATRYSGLLSFAITFKCTTDNVVDYAWHTEIRSGITIGTGMNNAETIVETYSDILDKWKKELFSVDGQIQTTARESLEAIENAKNNSLASIAQHGTVQVSNEEPTDPNVDLFINPDETVTISVPEIKDKVISDEDTWSSTKINQEFQAVNDKQIASDKETAELKGDVVKSKIIKNTSGSFIQVSDSVEDYLISFNIENIDADVIVTGRNLLKKDNRNNFVKLQLPAETRFTLVTNGELSEGGNIKFLKTDGTDKWFAIDKGAKISSIILDSGIQGFTELLVKKEGLEYALFVNYDGKYEEYKEQVVEHPISSDKISKLKTFNGFTLFRNSENVNMNIEYHATLTNKYLETIKKSNDYFIEHTHSTNVFNGIWHKMDFANLSYNAYTSDFIEIPENASRIYKYVEYDSSLPIKYITYRCYDDGDIEIQSGMFDRQKYKSDYINPKAKKLKIRVLFAENAEVKSVDNMYLYCSFKNLDVLDSPKNYQYIYATDKNVKTLMMKDLNNERFSFVNALDIGFVPNDKSFDNSLVLQDVVKKYKNIYFPEGVYYFKSSVSISQSRIKMRGIVNASKSNTPLFKSDNYTSYQGTVFKFTGINTFLTLSGNFGLIESIAIESNSYNIECNQSSQTFDGLFNISKGENEVNAIDLQSENFNVDNLFISGFNGFALRTNGQHRVLKNIDITHCAVGIIMNSFDHVLSDIWMNLCGKAIIFPEGGHYGINNSWFDCIVDDVITVGDSEKKQECFINSSGIWTDLNGGSFIKAYGKVVCVISGRIHRCNMKNAYLSDINCGNITGENIEANVMCDGEDRIYLSNNDIVLYERNLLHGNNSVKGFVVVTSRNNIANDMSSVFAIRNGKIVNVT